MNLALTSETVSTPAPRIGNARRFQVVLQTTAGVYVPSALVDSPETAVEMFMLQTRATARGKIRLVDRDEQRVVGCRVKLRARLRE